MVRLGFGVGALALIGCAGSHPHQAVADPTIHIEPSMAAATTEPEDTADDDADLSELVDLIGGLVEDEDWAIIKQELERCYQAEPQLRGWRRANIDLNDKGLPMFRFVRPTERVDPQRHVRVVLPDPVEVRDPDATMADCSEGKVKIWRPQS